MSYKDIWFAEMESKLNEKLDVGIPFNKAYDEASTEAFDSAANKLNEMVDVARLRAKEGRS